MDEYEKYYNRALHFLSYRPRSEKEVRDNLAKKRPPQAIVEKIIATLKEYKFLDDNQFASWWIEQRTRVKAKSKRIIRIELIQKGIDKDLIDELLSANAEEPVSDLDQAKVLAERAIRKYKDLEKFELYQKVGAYLGRRGYDWGTIKKAIDAVLEEQH